MKDETQVRVLQGRDKPIRYGHPWVFSGALGPTTAKRGIVAVLSSNGDPLGTAFYNPGCRLALRMLTRGGVIPFTIYDLRSRLSAAIDRRRHLIGQATDSVRLVFAESDGLPGLIVDKYADALSVQFNSAFAEHFRTDVISALAELVRPHLVFDTSDSAARERENLPAGRKQPGPAVIFHNQAMDFHNTAMEILSYGLRYRVAPGSGQKTGFYLDQAANRQIVAAHAQGRRVLDAFCYSGGFSLSCLKGGAREIIAIDSSATALQLLHQNLALNRDNLPANATVKATEADVFGELRRLNATGEKFDLIVLDPPKLAQSRSKTDAAEKAYKDLNLQALRLAAPGAFIATFSCSGAMTFEKLRQVLHYAAHDADREVQILQTLHQSEDHPVMLAFPESEYLRGYLCRVL